MIVLDASALIEKLTFGRQARQIERHLELAGAIVAPDLLHVEVASALWRMVRADRLGAADAASAVEELRDLPLLTVPHRDLLVRAWQLRESVRLTDAFYLACAESMDTSVLTTDARLARGHHGIPVTLVT